ncbi:ABC transporter permease [Thermatribacter velox]|uniref:ABC transporter permease n=1 Tax=Thermatribacter velox TaxID=3039681 RepID=A0ABZ2YBQ9_9BACT
MLRREPAINKIMAKSNKTQIYNNMLNVYGAHITLLFLFCLFALLSPAFISLRNLENLLTQSSFIGILALGLLFVVISGGIDLSIASIFALSSTLCALWQHHGIYLGYVEELSFLFPIYLIFPACILIGAGIGLFNGIIITKFHVPDFIATLGTMITIRALSFSVTGGQTVFGVSEGTKFLGRGSIGWIPFPVLVWIILAILSQILLKYTAFGSELFAIGESEEAARFCGVKIGRDKIMAYVLSGAFAAFAGLLMTGRLDSGEPRVGDGYELLAIAAVVIGGAPLTGGRGNAIDTLSGVLVLGIISNILNLLGIHPYPQMIFNSLILLAAVILRSYLNRQEL